MTTEKKARERWFLDRWLAIQETTATSIECSERPDFLVMLEHQHWGVEITTFNRSPKERERHERWDHIFRLVDQKAEHGNFLEGVHVHISFKDLPKQRQGEAFVERMFGFIRSLTLDEDRLRFDSADLPSSLSAHVSELRLNRTERKYLSWDSDEDDGAVGINDNELVETFQRKLDVKYYRPGVEKFALIIGGEPFAPVALMSPTLLRQIHHFDQFNQKIFGSVFDEVLIMDYDNHRWRRGEGWMQVEIPNSG